MPAGAAQAMRIVMVPSKAPLFELLAARMRWLGERQVVLGQNIANADTPDYRPKDLRDDAFARLAKDLAAAPARLALQVSDAAHLRPSPGGRLDLGVREQDRTFETAPNGNAVVLEEQMAKTARTAMDYQPSSDLYRKYLGMVRSPG